MTNRDLRAETCRDLPHDPIRCLGIDRRGYIAGLVRQALFANDAVPLAGTNLSAVPSLQAKIATVGDRSYGYLRVHTFYPRESPGEMLYEFFRICEESFTSVSGLILDVRSNSGGYTSIPEHLLQFLRPPGCHEIERTQWAFRNTEVMHAIIEENLGLASFDDLHQHLPQAHDQFTPYIPIPSGPFNQLRSRFRGNVVLITNATCYSATDVFVTGFIDNKCGEVLGLHDNIGRWRQRMGVR